MESPIETWINKLQIQLSKLRYNARIGNLTESEEQLEKCRSFLGQIYNHINLQKAKYSDYRFEIEEIQDQMISIRDIIDKRRNTIGNKLKNKIRSFLNILSSLLGLGGRFGDYLLGNDDSEPKLLE